MQMKKPDRKEKIAVVVGTVTNDHRQWRVPANMKVCALRVTEQARSRIEKAGGKIMTFDQLALKSPRGQNTVLLQGGCGLMVTYITFITKVILVTC